MNAALAVTVAMALATGVLRVLLPMLGVFIPGYTIG